MLQARLAERGFGNARRPFGSKSKWGDEEPLTPGRRALLDLYIDSTYSLTQADLRKRGIGPDSPVVLRRDVNTYKYERTASHQLTPKLQTKLNRAEKQLAEVSVGYESAKTEQAGSQARQHAYFSVMNGFALNYPGKAGDEFDRAAQGRGP